MQATQKLSIQLNYLKGTPFIYEKDDEIRCSISKKEVLGEFIDFRVAFRKENDKIWREDTNSIFYDAFDGFFDPNELLPLDPKEVIDLLRKNLSNKASIVKQEAREYYRVSHRIKVIQNTYLKLVKLKPEDLKQSAITARKRENSVWDDIISSVNFIADYDFLLNNDEIVVFENMKIFLDAFVMCPVSKQHFEQLKTLCQKS